MTDTSEHVRVEETVASVCFGWCLALATLATYRILSTWIVARRRTKSHLYFLLCSLLVLSSTILAVLAWAYLLDEYRPGVSDFAAFLFLWSFEAQVYFQIILNRICILDMRPRLALKIRISVALLILFINIGMFTLWLPYRSSTTTSNMSESISFWSTRVEKIIYFLLDLGLNGFFIHQVRTKLMQIGLLKYRALIHYNYRITTLSLACDVLLFGMQWFPRNNALFIIVHPVIFLNKLVLEMSVCGYMAMVSRRANQLATLALVDPHNSALVNGVAGLDDAEVDDEDDERDSVRKGPDLETLESFNAARRVLSPLGEKRLPGLPLSIVDKLPSRARFLLDEERPSSKLSKLSYYSVCV